jgi:diguanylate cyclase (GGDEF)-like protein/PAS domain S-box-containing protein
MDLTGTHILIVDDNLDNLNALHHMLKKIGFDVQTAQDGESALKKANSHNFDLVLLDIVMPHMDGYEVLKNLRIKFSMIELPIIMLTAVSENCDIVKALSLGANDYVIKPYDFSVINSRIRTQISLKKTQEALKQSEERYTLAAQATQDGLWDWDLITNQIYYSSNWKAILGYSEKQIKNIPDEWLKRVHPADKEQFELNIEKLKKGKIKRFVTEQRLIHKNGSYRWVVATGIAVTDGNGTCVRLAGSMTDITDRRIYNALTGLPNQILLLDQLERVLRQIKAKTRETAALLFIDLDRFKLINQALGMMAGDNILVQISQRLTSCISSDDILAHFGRDEFLVLLNEYENLKKLSDTVICLKGTINKPLHIPAAKEEISVSASIGVVIIDEKYESVEKALQDAESAMQRAKSSGPNNFRFFIEEMYTQVKERLKIESRLRKAMEREELVLFYQPQVNIGSGEIVGVEALVNWYDPEKGLITPNKLIPLAEDNGMIVPMGDWIMHEACCQHKRWQDEGLYLQRIAVNLSPIQFSQRDLYRTLKKILEKTHLDPQYLELEITESNAMQDAEKTIKIMNRLTELGISFSIDDFGTGYSSLSILKRFPLSTLKIDRSFIQDVPNDEDAVAIVKAIIAMAHSLKFEIIAEGVENQQQLDFLRNLSCQNFQGFLFSRPLPAKEITQLLKSTPIPHHHDIHTKN